MTIATVPDMDKLGCVEQVGEGVRGQKRESKAR